MMHVQNQVTAIVETDTKTLLRKYEKQIDDLKHELMLHDALTPRVDAVCDDHTLAQKDELKCMIERFLEAPTAQVEDNVLRLHSVRDIRESFRQFKSIYKTLEGSFEAVRRNQSASNSMPEAIPAESTGNRKSHTNSQKSILPDVQESVVGKPDSRSFGFGIGDADANAKPNVLECVPRLHDQCRRQIGVSTAENKDDRKVSHPMERVGITPLSNELKSRAFHEYKIGSGKLAYRKLQEEKDVLHALKQKIKGISRRLSGVKGIIDQLQINLETKRSQHRYTTALASGQTIDEEEYALAASIPEQERAYRALFEELKMTKCKFDKARSAVDSCRASLVRDFECWFSRNNDPHTVVDLTLLNTSTLTLSLPKINSCIDQLDACEQFDRMEIERVRAQAPDSLAFVQAKRAMRQNSEHASQIRLQRNAKRGL